MGSFCKKESTFVLLLRLAHVESEAANGFRETRVWFFFIWLLCVYVMTQLRPVKMLSALGLSKTRLLFFLGRPYIQKCVLLIKVWTTTYKPKISPIFYRCWICLRCCNIYNFLWCVRVYYKSKSLSIISSYIMPCGII